MTPNDRDDFQRGTGGTGNPVELLLGRLRQALGDLIGDPGLASQDLTSRLTPAVESFLAQFELVPKREFEHYAESLERLRATIAELEQRVAELERQEPTQRH
jgi:BMFP domain-containing protein YqiC